MNRWTFIVAVAGAVAAIGSASANLTITPTFDSSIASDPNAAIIESTIAVAILTYEQLFTNPIDVAITFQEGGGLGGSSFNLYDISYSAFSTALYNNAHTTMNPTQLAAVAANPISLFNPVTGTNDILMKCANIDALFGAGSSGCASAGTITLNTSLTMPGSPSSASLYSLLTVTEHEIDEILGLGSTLGLGLSGDTCGFSQTSGPCTNVPSPEDLFRYANNGTRGFTTATTTNAYFSIDGTTDLAQFNNTNNGADFGDWKSGVTPQVQDAIGTPGATPTLGPAEIAALTAIGYDVPEPGTFAVFAVGMAGLSHLRRRRG
jgi:hypothetical protein